MNLFQLCEDISYVVIKGDENCEVTGIAYHSKNVQAGNAFVCIPGLHQDGHDFIAEGISRGASVIFVERIPPMESIPAYVTIVKTRDNLHTLAHISATFFGHPERDMTLIGVTGTKGKTTTTYMLREIFRTAGKKVGLIGTIGCYLGEENVPLMHTTPPSYEIFRLLAEMKKRHCEYVIMEVSSQGLMKKRVEGINFRYGVFTNLSMDHIGPGEHQSFEEYAHWKKQLFSQCETAIINGDDPYGEYMKQASMGQVTTYGSRDADITFSGEMKLKSKDFLGSVFDVHTDGQEFTCTLGLAGSFNIYNALAAIAISLQENLPVEIIKTGLMRLRIKGRAEVIVSSDRYYLMIDYAHNAISLQSLLLTLREYQPSRLVCIFGCGGNRSKKRRAAMGMVSGNYADLTIVTEDNSREEGRMSIIMDILQGLAKTSGEYLVIPDRKDAIRYSMKFSQPGDFIVLAGKGHENYMEIGGHRVPFDEREIVRSFL